MARYTCSLTVALANQDIHASLIQLFQSCKFEVIYDTTDYIMGREVPGDVPFAKLVTVEGLIEKSRGVVAGQAQVNLVIKNEELPLQANNHCRQMFDQLQQAIQNHADWKVLNIVAY
jgi:hypothetical protein